MSFFDFQQNDLEQHKPKSFDGRPHQSEDMAVYNWGDENYDGLGDALQEGGDDLNDETFGGSGNVGEIFNPYLNLAPFPSYRHQGRTSTSQIPYYPTTNEGQNQPTIRLRIMKGNIWLRKCLVIPV